MVNKMSTSDSWSQYYEKTTNTKPQVAEGFIARVFLSTRPVKALNDYDFSGKKLLDIGCGDGRHVDLFQRLGFKVTGTEVSEQKVEQLKSKFQDSEFFTILSEELGTLDDRFDFAVAVNSIYYLNNKSTLDNNLENVIKILQPGGVFVASFLGQHHFVLNELDKNETGVCVLKSKDQQCEQEVKIKYFKSKEELYSLLERVGFVNIKIGEISDELCGKNRHLYYIIANNRS